jgi:hypothetical protein
MRKNAKKLVLVDCSRCGTPFNKELREVKRQNKKGRFKFYCGNCSKHPDFKTDALSPFRRFIRSAQRRNFKKDIEISILPEDLSRIWEKQKGICPYTGYNMELGAHYTTPMNTPKSASLDRIDSSKGYVEGNVEFVCLAVNYAKNGFSKEVMLDFFKR